MTSNKSGKRSGEVDVLTAHKKLDEGKAILVDVRSAGEFAGVHAASAVNIPLPEVERRFAELPTNLPVLVICQSGHRSSLAVGKLRALGMKNVTDVQGGTSAWQLAGLPVETASWECPLCTIVPSIVKSVGGFMRKRGLLK